MGPGADEKRRRQCGNCSRSPHPSLEKVQKQTIGRKGRRTVGDGVDHHNGTGGGGEAGHGKHHE